MTGDIRRGVAVVDGDGKVGPRLQREPARIGGDRTAGRDRRLRLAGEIDRPVGAGVDRAATSGDGDMDSMDRYGTRAELIGQTQAQCISADRDADHLSECVVAQTR